MADYVDPKELLQEAVQLAKRKCDLSVRDMLLESTGPQAGMRRWTALQQGFARKSKSTGRYLRQPRVSSNPHSQARPVCIPCSHGI